MTKKRFKILGHIEGCVNEVIDDIRYCYILLDIEEGGQEFLSNLKAITVDMSKPDLVEEKHKQMDYAGWEAQLQRVEVVSPKPAPTIVEP